MTDQPTCGACRFWLGDDDGGYCRRRAPTVVVMQWEQTSKYHDSAPLTSEAMSFFPKVERSSWCGEHEPAGGGGGWARLKVGTTQHLAMYVRDDDGTTGPPPWDGSVTNPRFDMPSEGER